MKACCSAVPENGMDMGNATAFDLLLFESCTVFVVEEIHGVTRVHQVAQSAVRVNMLFPTSSSQRRD
jgi:hypothetical protein